MTQQLALSRWRFPKRQLRIDTFLRTLDIDFRVDPEQDFWQANRHILPELREAMQDAVRERMHELHPDKGGDTEEFRNLIASYKQALKDFSRAFPNQERQDSSEQIPAERAARRRWMQARAARRRRQGNEQFKAYRRELYQRRKATGYKDPTIKERATRYRKGNADALALKSYLYRKRNPDRVRKWRKNYKESCKRCGIKPKRGREKSRLIKGTPEYKRRLEWRRDQYEANKDRINAARRVKNPKPQIRGFKGRFVKELALAA